MSDSETKVRLLEAAYSLMLANGYAATSVSDICEKAGLSKGSFYHFFASKEACALATLKAHMSDSIATLEAGLDLAGLTPAQAAVRYVQHVEESSEEIWRNGCLVGAFALEISETQPAIREEVSQVFRDLTDHLETVFTPLCRSTTAASPPSARELAEQFITVVEGGVVLARAHNDNRFIPQGLRCFRRYLTLLLPGS